MHRNAVVSLVFLTGLVVGGFIGMLVEHQVQSIMLLQGDIDETRELRKLQNLHAIKQLQLDIHRLTTQHEIDVQWLEDRRKRTTQTAE